MTGFGLVKIMIQWYLRVSFSRRKDFCAIPIQKAGRGGQTASSSMLIRQCLSLQDDIHLLRG